METVPAYVTIVFLLTTFTAIGFLLRATRKAGLGLLPSQILIFILPLWIFFQAALSVLGFYEDFTSVPPRLFLFGILPALLLVLGYIAAFHRTYVERLPLKLLTLLHIVRIPVELVLLWLSIAGQVPRMMTFQGLNFDILSGIAAPIVAWLAFRGGETRRGLLIAFNVIGILLLANVVVIAALSVPSSIQFLNIAEPNRAVLYFPYIYLPTIVVPIVLFSHLASLYKLLRADRVGS
ncbi:MAG TPA: hypothetical protein PLD38_07500 [Pyrinomonadaceae bacterium]|nr:hypothetical protein [Chloracidobacterium sp.]MBP9935977.1 hypothetical protein [Pyrinomonadaceae bacterium]MBK7803809.1 hypothetical protein [Chloracidobacterium sp.]MBK9439519.1 hypothetical protein [Chloracidobacterium sp.]MBK9768357.1 hypothetical protein [Chloracidobacterium sp.]